MTGTCKGNGCPEKTPRTQLPFGLIIFPKLFEDMEAQNNKLTSAIKILVPAILFIDRDGTTQKSQDFAREHYKDEAALSQLYEAVTALKCTEIFRQMFTAYGVIFETTSDDDYETMSECH